MESENSKLEKEEGESNEHVDVKEHSKLKKKADDSENSSEYDESDDNDMNGDDVNSEVTSVYSTNNTDIIHQRKKEKLLKRKFLTIAKQKNTNTDANSVAFSDMTSKLNASVGTSKISNKSFRNLTNLSRLNIIPHSYKQYRILPKVESILETFTGEDSKIEVQKKEANKLKTLKQYIQQWKKYTYEAKLKRNIGYEPTFRLEPKEKIRVNAIISKCKNTLDRLVKKNNKYDPAYTSKLIQIAVEMVKENVKSFEYDRYKVIVHVTILQKIVSQSFLMTSSCLWSSETDRNICIKIESETFYLICYVFLIFHE